MSQVLILIAFMFSFVLAMSAAFLRRRRSRRTSRRGRSTRCSPGRCAAPTSSSAAGSGCPSWSPRYAALSGLLAIAVVDLVSGHVPPEPLVAVGFLAFQAVTVLTLALALGTRLPAIAAGAVTVVLFGLGWFVGVLGNLAVAFDASRSPAGRVPPILIPTDGLWRGVIYGLEPPLVLLIAAGPQRRGARGRTRSSRARRRRSRSSPGASSGWCSCSPPGSRCSGARRALARAGPGG